MSKAPKLWVVAGPNGAGKSTLVNKRRLEQYIPFINPDNIAREINPNHQDDVVTVVQAGRIAREMHIEYLDTDRSFGIETTLSGHAIPKMIKEAKEKGYQVNLVFVGLKSVKNSALRVAARVKEGGHNVPEDAIQRRYPQSLDNLIKIAAVVDRLYIFDNSGEKHHLLLNMEKEKVKHKVELLPDWANNIISKIIDQRTNLIPCQTIVPLNPSRLSELVMSDERVRVCREAIENLSNLVFRVKDILNKDLDAICHNPNVVQELASTIENCPEKIALLSGKSTLFGQDKIRQNAQANIVHLGQSIEDYANTCRQTHYQIIHQHHLDTRRKEQAVELTPRDIKNILSLPHEQQLQTLKKSPELQREFNAYLQKINHRLSPDEKRALAQGDIAQLAKSLNVSTVASCDQI